MKNFLAQQGKITLILTALCVLIYLALRKRGNASNT